MMDAGRHPNIETLTYSEVVALEGRPGDFRATIKKNPRYVREDLCTGCSECTKVCPVEVASEFDEGLSKRHAVYRPFPQAVPNIFTISRKGMPPCQSVCAIHQNAEGYIALIAQGKYQEALEVILRDNPLPSICGRVCTHPCTSACTRNEVDEPVNIPALKRFVLDWVLANGIEYHLPKPDQKRHQKVAIVGSGPAGLVCAYELRKMGYETEVFESQNVAGGMLAVGIPDYRLPREILKKEIGKLEEIGVQIRLNSPVGPEGVSLKRLQDDYDAVFIGVGAHVERKLMIPGEDLPGVWGGVEFLRRVNLGEKIQLGKRVIVIGGGNSAIDD